MTFEPIDNGKLSQIRSEIAANNMEAVPLEKAPKVAVYPPKEALPWDDAVVVSLSRYGADGPGAEGSVQHATFSLADQKGSVVFLYFGYTHCPDVCPTTLSDWKRIKTALGRDASRVRFVFISVDPARDDPATLQHYVSTFDPSFIGATGDSATLAHIERSFHVMSGREETGSANGYAVIHPSQTFVVDKRGNLMLLYSFGTNTSDIVADIRQLLSGA